MWLYHRSGGDGLQLTKKPNDQKDVGEPVFSPDGRYVYFSQDITPGRVFEYNKDPNDRDLRHPAARPADRRSPALRHRRRAARSARPRRRTARPSPSSAGCATRACSTCMDLRSGDELADLRRPRPRHAGDLGDPRPLPGDGLDARQQVARLLGRRQDPPHRRRQPQGRGDPLPRPHHAAGHRRPCASPSRSRPKSFETRMLRWVNVSPKGDRVVYPGARPSLGPRSAERQAAAAHPAATRSDPGRSSPPSRATAARWSTPPGTTTSWAPCASSRPTAARGGWWSSEPGQYVEPAFTPDGKQVVYREDRGAASSAPRPGRDAGNLSGTADRRRSSDAGHRAGGAAPLRRRERPRLPAAGRPTRGSASSSRSASTARTSAPT